MKLKWGIIGPGIIAEKFAKALKINGSDLVAVASRSYDRSKSFAEKYNIPKIYEGYQTLLTDEDVDIVYIATPHAFHKEWIVKSLRAGKHVLCEKPITLTAAELEECIAVAKEENKFLMEAMWTRFLPIYRDYIDKLIQTKKLGDIRIINIDYSFMGNTDPDYRILNKSLGGGAMLDVGIYALHIIEMFLGLPTEIKAVCHIGNTDVDMQSATAMKFDNLAVATLTNGIACAGTEYAQIIGTKGRIVLHSFGRCELAEETLNCQNTQKIKMPFENGFQYQIKECESCIANGKTQSDILPLSKSLEIMGFMDKIREDFKTE